MEDWPGDRWELIHMWTQTHTHSQLVSQVMSSNRLAVTELTDQHDSLSLSGSVSFRLSLFPSHYPSQSRQHTDPMAVWHFYKNKWAWFYVTIYPVGQLSNRSTSLCNQTATQWFQPADFYSQPTNQLACVPFCCVVHLSDCPSVSACLTVYLSLCLPVYQTVGMSDVDRLL